MTEREELKPCKCGFGLGVIEQIYNKCFVVWCDSCGFEVHSMTEHESAAAWNREAEG